jgi:hypothetical protein
MRLRYIAIFCVLSVSMVISGCKINNGQKDRVLITPEPVVATNIKNDKKNKPNPKPKAKIEPGYPTTDQVIAWHANQCGGFKLVPSKHIFTGESELKRFFKFICLNISNDPNTVMTKLLKLDLAYFWPDDIKQYLWLQKQHITMQINAKKEQQALNNKMQETLSSLATIEQQLLLREEIKEQ